MSGSGRPRPVEADHDHGLGQRVVGKAVHGVVDAHRRHPRPLPGTKQDAISTLGHRARPVGRLREVVGSRTEPGPPSGLRPATRTDLDRATDSIRHDLGQQDLARHRVQIGPLEQCGSQLPGQGRAAVRPRIRGHSQDCAAGGGDGDAPALFDTRIQRSRRGAAGRGGCGVHRPSGRGSGLQSHVPQVISARLSRRQVGPGGRLVQSTFGWNTQRSGEARPSSPGRYKSPYIPSGLAGVGEDLERLTDFESQGARC